MSSFEIEIEGGPSFTVDVTAVGPQGDPGVVSVEYPLVLDDPNNTISIASGYFALQSSLANYLTISSAQSTYAPLISPSLSGIPQAPTAAQGTATQQIATTGFVDAWFAPKASPTFSGVVTVPTATQGDNSQKAASTAFVGSALSAGLAPYLTSASAAATYYPLTNPSGFITASALNGYATESWVQTQGYLTSANLSGYATESWVTSQGYITSSALSPYLLSSTAASTYQVIGDYATNTALTNGLAGKANTVHTHDASAIVSGTIDLARIPIIPSQVQVVSTQNSIANLTPSEQAQITGAGVLVTTTDGNRWVYSGSGSKTDQASYVKVADITPDWTEVANKPAFGTASLADTGDFYPSATNPAGYLVSSDLTPYLTSADAALTYQPIGDYATNTALTNGLALKLDKPTVAGTTGQILSTDGTSNIWINNFARTLSCSVRNETGSTVTKGTIVYLSGASGNKPLIQKAIASSEAGSSKTFGIVSADIQTNQNGEVVSVGELVNVNTLGLTEGVSLWLSPTTAGAWTTTKPAAPNHAVFIGTVVRAHQTQGVVEVRIQNGFELSELHDVSIPSPSDNDVVVYESATSLYKGKSISTIIGGTPATESWVTSQGYLTAPYNPFDQSLNKDESVKFNQIVAGPTVTGMPYGFIANALGFYFNDSTGGGGYINGTIQSDGIEVNKAGSSTWLRSGGIEFPDGSLQTTAFTGSTNPFNQSLNTTDSVVFATIDASRDVSIVKSPDSASEIPLVRVRQDQQLATLSAGNLYLYDSSFGAGTMYAYNGIFFNDGSSQNTAFVPANYLTASQVSSTYQTISGMSAYQTISGMSAYQTISGMSDYAALASANSFTTTQSITANSASAALTVTQTGIGNSFVVNDQAGDATPFVINSAGLVGLNVSNPAAMLDIAHSLTSGTGIRLAVASGQSFNASAGLLFVNIQNTGATGKGLVIENRGTGDCLYIHDSAATDTTPFVVDNDGNCIIGGQTITAGYKLDVRGNAKVNALKVGSSSDITAVTPTASNPNIVANFTYDKEVEIVIGGVTYRMPARL